MMPTRCAGSCRRNYMQPDDNPPVGLLLCTEYGQEKVEYVTPKIDPNLFVAQYELQLPSKEKMREFLLKENRVYLVHLSRISF